MKKNNEILEDEVLNNEEVNDEVIYEQQEVLSAEEVEKNALEEVTEKLQEEENRRLRLLADYENFKRRATLDKESIQKYRSQNVLTNLIPVLDNFYRALQVEVTSEEATTLMTGMEMIYRSLIDALTTEGLVEIDALDKEFDPNFHQAIMTESNPDKPSGSVLEELQKGYMLKDRVLRPSMVKVNE
ncbi:nucleotide exchange factor GrpE [Sporosarcina sp. CAU 1771]